MKIRVYLLDVSVPRWLRYALIAGIPAVILATTALVRADVKNVFAAGDPLSSAKLNENFSALNARIQTLESRPAVGSPGTSSLIVASALVDSSTGTVTASDGAWISAATRKGLGEVILTIAPGTFTARPNCVAATEQTAAGGASFAVENASTTSLLVTIIGRTGNLEDREFSIVCVGAR